jgi:hypothetical protein
MDIENLRKIQEAQKALRIHNINISTDEAVDGVKNDIYVGGTKVPTFDDVFEEVQSESKLNSIQTINKEVIPMDNNAVNELNRKVNEQATIIDQQAKLIFQLQNVVNDIIREINKMQTSVPTKNPAERQQVLRPEEKKEHPRSGGVNPDDVSIEKFFYAGGGR